MTTSLLNGRIVVPGDILCINDITNNYQLGLGVYQSNDNIISSLVGNVLIEYLDNNVKTIHVIIPSMLSNPNDNVININDILICKVNKITTNQIYVDIILNGDKELRIYAKGIIRREDIRSNEIDKIIMYECYRPGDLIKAIVISYGDSRQYYLSTADNNLGVLVAKSEQGNIMIPINEHEMRDTINGVNEKRKVAKMN